MIRDMNCCSSEPEIDRTVLGSKGAWDGVLVTALVYGTGEEREETGEERWWEIAEGGAGVGENWLGEGGSRCHGDGDAGAWGGDTEGRHVDPVSGDVRLAQK
jgi:hypothetical protein